MTTNSFGGALPRFDYPTIQPVVQKASRMSGLSLPVRLVSIAAAAGFGKPVYYTQFRVQKANKALSSYSLLLDIPCPRVTSAKADEIKWVRRRLVQK